jgi:hypothetical protein
MADASLAAGLKQAKSKKMFFAFVGKGTDGKLIVSRTKISAKDIAAAKKETGGSMAVTGKCFGDGSSSLVFLVARPPAATLGAAIKKAAQRDAGLTISPDVQVASDADEDEDTSAAATGTPASSAQAPATPAPVPPPNLAPWQAARQSAINDLKGLATKVAATKHKDAVGVLKEIQSIITNLKPHPASHELNKLEAYIRHEDVITAAEEVPGHFHSLSIRKPLLDALQALKQ